MTVGLVVLTESCSERILDREDMADRPQLRFLTILMTYASRQRENALATAGQWHNYHASRGLWRNMADFFPIDSWQKIRAVALELERNTLVS